MVSPRASQTPDSGRDKSDHRLHPSHARSFFRFKLQLNPFRHPHGSHAHSFYSDRTGHIQSGRIERKPTRYLPAGPESVRRCQNSLHGSDSPNSGVRSKRRIRPFPEHHWDINGCAGIPTASQTLGRLWQLSGNGERCNHPRRLHQLGLHQPRSFGHSRRGYRHGVDHRGSGCLFRCGDQLRWDSLPRCLGARFWHCMRRCNRNKSLTSHVDRLSDCGIQQHGFVRAAYNSPLRQSPQLDWCGRYDLEHGYHTGSVFGFQLLILLALRAQRGSTYGRRRFRNCELHEREADRGARGCVLPSKERGQFTANSLHGASEREPRGSSSCLHVRTVRQCDCRNLPGNPATGRVPRCLFEPDHQRDAKCPAPSLRRC